MKPILISWIVAVVASSAFAKTQPNVVLIVCDDLNDYITGIPGGAGHPQAITPHMDRLANSGVAFRHAYSNNPVCAPSRSSFLTGIYGHTSGNLFWSKWFQNPVLKNSRSLMDHFKQNGYFVAGSGKLMHHGKPNEWSTFKHKADYGPQVYDGESRVAQQCSFGAACPVERAAVRDKPKMLGPSRTAVRETMGADNKSIFQGIYPCVYLLSLCLYCRFPY